MRTDVALASVMPVDREERCPLLRDDNSSCYASLPCAAGPCGHSNRRGLTSRMHVCTQHPRRPTLQLGRPTLLENVIFFAVMGLLFTSVLDHLKQNRLLHNAAWPVLWVC